jgi:2'-5' RNA ligase/GNAT superfamily N-acetyltransferase
VALLLPPAVAAEVDGLRRALGSDDIDRLPPHLTLVPPVNVREDELDDALDRVRDAAHRTRPFRLELGPPATFLPVNPVLYLAVAGDVVAVDALRDRVFRPPLERPLTWPFHPHVTVLDGGDPDRIRAAVDVLAGWRAEVVLERLHLLEEWHRPDGVRAWRPIADAAFGEPAVVGRGGLELELEVTERLPADASALRDEVFDAADQARFGEPWRPEPLAVVARRRGRVVGAVEGRVRPHGVADVSTLAVAAEHRREGVGAHLVAAFASAAADRGATRLTVRTEAGGEAAGFYRRLGFVPSFTLPGWGRDGVDVVQLTKPL